MATAFVFVWLLTSAGGVRAATSFSTGGMIAVVGTFITTLIAVTVVIVCLFLPRKHRQKKETPGSPVNETGIGRSSPLESNGRNNPPESPNDIECGSIVHEEHVTVTPANQTAVLNQRASNKKRLNKVDSAQKLDLEVKTNSVTASVDEKKRQGETSINRKSVKQSFSYDGRLPLAYTCLNDEETSVTLVSRDPIGLGFNIYGNMTEGIFVREVLSRGPAVESGVISQGDRILSVSISTAHMVLEDALTILSYASSYPVTLRISKTPGQETIFRPSGQLSSQEELRTSSMDVRLRERGSRRPSVNPLYRSQSLDNLVDVKAGADRSISEFRSSEHLTRRFSEFRASPECFRRNKKASALYRWNVQQNELELERLYRADAMELTLASEDLTLDGTRLSMHGEPCDTNGTANRGDIRGENSERNPPVDLEQSTRCAETLTNQDTSNEEVGASLKNVSNLEDSRVTATVANGLTNSHNIEEDGFLENVSIEDTRIDIDDFERQVTVRCSDDIEIDIDGSHVVKNDSKASDVSLVSPRFGVIDSDSNISLNGEHFDHMLTRNSDVDEPFDRLQHSAESLSSNSEQYAMNKQTGSSETESIGGGRSSGVRSENNSGISDRIAERFRNVAVNLDENENCDMDDSEISGLEVLGRVENEEERYEGNRGERIDQKDVTSAVKCSTVIHVKDHPVVDSSSSKLTAIDVIEPSQLSPTNSSPSTKGFLKTLKRLFNVGQNKTGDGETSREDETQNKTRKRGNRKNGKSVLASTEKTGGSNSDRQINEGYLTVEVHAEDVQELSFADAAVGKDGKVPEEDIDKVIADFMGISSQTGKSEAREVSSPMEWNHVTGDGITTEPSELNSVVAALRTDGAIDDPLELKSDICQTSSQNENETGVADEVSDSEVTEFDKNLAEGVDNSYCAREQLHQEIFLENSIDVVINQHSEISCEPIDSSNQKGIANGISSEPDSPAETSINIMETDTSQIPVRSANDSSAETQKLELTEVVASAHANSHSGGNQISIRSANVSSGETQKPKLSEIVASAHVNSHPQNQITVISPLLKKFHVDRHDTKVIKPILKKLSSVPSTEDGSFQNTEWLAKMSDIPGDQVQPTRTASTSSLGQKKEIPNVIPKDVTTPDECRINVEAIWRGDELEPDTQVTCNERTRETNSERLVESNNGTVGKLQDDVNDSEAEESEAEMDMAWSMRAPPNYYACHHEIIETESGADESWGSVPEPNYASFPESFEAESDKEESSLDSTPMPNYANFPEEVEQESEEDFLYTGTIIPNCADYPGVTNAGFRRGKSDTQPESQCYNGVSLLDTISDDFAELRKENQDPAASTMVSDCNNETKTPSQVMKSLLEKLQSFGKRDFKERRNEIAVSDSSDIVLSQPQEILIPFEKTGDGRRENHYNEYEEIRASGLSGIYIDVSKSKEARSTWKLSEGNINSSYIACESEVEPIKVSERSEVFIVEDAGERSRVVFYPKNVLVSEHDELNPEQGCTAKGIGDINNNSKLPAWL